MIRNILLLLLAYTFVPPSVRPSTPVVDVVKTRDTKAFVRNCCCKRRPSFWICVFWTLVLMIFPAVQLLEAVLKQRVKNSPAFLTLGQRGISYVGSMMGRLCKHRVPGVSRLMTSLRCSVIAVLEELTPTECICAQWLGVHGFDCSTSSFLCCAVLWTAYKRRHMPTPLSCRCLSALVPIALQSSWPDVVAAFLVPTFPVGGRIPRDPDGTEQGAEGQEDQGPDQEFANIADEAGTADTRPAPLHNGGNSCYMNAAFQCLWACPAARDVLQRAYENAPTTAKQSLTMLARKARDSRKPLSPAAAKDVLLGDAFQQAMQQDPPPASRRALRIVAECLPLCTRRASARRAIIFVRDAE